MHNSHIIDILHISTVCGDILNKHNRNAANNHSPVFHKFNHGPLFHKFLKHHPVELKQDEQCPNTRWWCKFSSNTTCSSTCISNSLQHKFKWINRETKKMITSRNCAPVLGMLMLFSCHFPRRRLFLLDPPHHPLSPSSLLSPPLVVSPTPLLLVSLFFMEM